jgi:hypothetical protein
MGHPLLEEDPMWEVLRIVNEPGMTWKVRRALLRDKCKLTEDVIIKLVPEDAPTDY